MNRKTGAAALTGGMAALIVATAVAGVPLWATLVLIVLGLPVATLTVLTWMNAVRHG